jgi:hypothetical protein
MRTTNPGVKLKLSDIGPVVRFVTAVIPTITDEPRLLGTYNGRSQKRRRVRSSALSGSGPSVAEPILITTAVELGVAATRRKEIVAG